MENYFDKIKSIRKSKGLSQIEIAQIVGISQTAYGKIESGITKSISIDVGVGISAALEVPFVELFEIENRDVEISLLKNQIDKLQISLDEKKFMIETLKNERSHIKQHLVMQMVSGFSFDISFLESQLEKITEGVEVSFLTKKKNDLLRMYRVNKEYYFKTGYLTQQDFDEHIKEMEGIYHKEVE